MPLLCFLIGVELALLFFPLFFLQKDEVSSSYLHLMEELLKED